MLFGSIINAMKRLAHAALAIFVLVAAPLADAVACAGDGFESSSAISADLDMSAGQHVHEPGDGDERPPLEGGHCEHGHCHNAATFEGGNSAQTHTVLRDGPVSLDSARLIPDMPGGLERPPKA